MVLVATDPLFAEHDPGRGHPERPARLDAVLAGIDMVGVEHTVLERRAATRAELERVHPGAYLDTLERVCANGGGPLDADTAVSGRSFEAAISAAGAGLAAIEALDAGRSDSAFLAIRLTRIVTAIVATSPTASSTYCQMLRCPCPPLTPACPRAPR